MPFTTPAQYAAEAGGAAGGRGDGSGASGGAEREAQAAKAQAARRAWGPSASSAGVCHERPGGAAGKAAAMPGHTTTRADGRSAARVQ